jgi:hypothetical protein
MTNIYNNHLISDKTMAAPENDSKAGFSDFWGLSEHGRNRSWQEVGGVSNQVLAKPESAETEAGMFCEEVLPPDSKKPSKMEEDKCVCAYCDVDLCDLKEARSKFIGHVRSCNELSKLISCPVCDTDMAKKNIIERRTHVEACQEEQAKAFLIP